MAFSHACHLLPPLAHSLLQHHFRLDRSVRVMEARVRLRNRGNGWKATRQIELERQRLGRELHTGVGQMLAAVRLQLELIAVHLDAPPAPVRQALERISVLVRNALEEVRAVSRRLHPPDWQKLNLAEALALLWQTSGVPEKYHARLEVESPLVEPDLNRKILIYRTLQEALSNITRHSRATHVRVTLNSEGSKWTLAVVDDGVGFDAVRLFSGAPTAAAGIGLQSVREHAVTLGGRLDVQSGPLGTKLELSVPLSA
jgi:signal transduction histidine kinase